MASLPDVDLGDLLAALTPEELLAHRADVIAPSALQRFSELFSIENPRSWVQLNQLRAWLVRQAHIPDDNAPTPATPRVKAEVKSENDVIDLSSPLPPPKTRQKRAWPRLPLADASQEILVISSDSESDAPVRKQPKGETIKVTRQLKVEHVEHIEEIPRCWPIPETRVAYILDLSSSDRKWETEKGDPVSMETVIRDEDQDNWGGRGGHRMDVKKCPQVDLLGGQRCQHVVLQCQGCHTCDRLDPDLLRRCVRRDYDADEMRHVWEAERKISEVQGSSVENITATFYNQIQTNVCPHDECEGSAVMRAWKKSGTNLDGKAYFIGCSAWKKTDPKNVHRFLPIPYGVDEDMLLEIIQNHGTFPGESNEGSTCGLVVPRRIGAKMKKCPYVHTEDKKIVIGSLIVRSCPAMLDIFVPLDLKCHMACIVPRSEPHNHPAYPERKLSPKAEQKYTEAVQAYGVMGASVGRVDKAASTRTILGGVSPPKFHPALGQRRQKQKILKKLKDQEAPKGYGLAGVLARKEKEKEFPADQRYIHRIADIAGMQLVVTMLPRLAGLMHTVRASLHDNTYKRTFGKWKEWEVVIFDDRLNMRLTVARVYCDHESAEAFEHIWRAFHEVLEEVTGRPLKIRAFHKDGIYIAVLLDGDAGQALGLGRWLHSINDPEISGIHETDPAILVQYILKTCWTHCAKNLDSLALHVPNPADMKYIRSFEHMQSDEEVEAFREFCRNHAVKQVRDWYENKARHKWYLPSLNQHLSRIPKNDWAIVPQNTNFGESAHAHTNFYTGIGHSLLSGIDAAYKYDLEREQAMILAEETCILKDSRNTFGHRMQFNANRRAARAQNTLDRAEQASKIQELEDLNAQVDAELKSRRAPTLLTAEERKASLLRSKVLQERVALLKGEGVALKRGRKPKRTALPASQPATSKTQTTATHPAGSLTQPSMVSHPSLSDRAEFPFLDPSSGSGQMDLDADLDPSNFGNFDFDMSAVFGDPFLVDGNGAGPSTFPGAMAWGFSSGGLS